MVICQKYEKQVSLRRRAGKSRPLTLAAVLPTEQVDGSYDGFPVCAASYPSGRRTEDDTCYSGRPGLSETQRFDR